VEIVTWPANARNDVRKSCQMEDEVGR